MDIIKLIKFILRFEKDYFGDYSDLISRAVFLRRFFVNFDRIK